MKIALIADIHGNFGLLCSKVKEYCPQADLILVPGDLSPFRYPEDFKGTKIPEHHRLSCKFEYLDYYEGRKQIPIPTYFIGGNHEPNRMLTQLVNSQEKHNHKPVKLIDNLYFIGYHGEMDLAGTTLIGISGNYSSKFYEYRRGSLPDIRQRHFVKEDIEYAYSVPRIHILMTHDWPSSLEKELKGRRFFSGTFSPQLDKLIQDKSPDIIIAGHMHFPFSANIGNSKFLSVGILNDKSILKSSFIYRDHEFFVIE